MTFLSSQPHPHQSSHRPSLAKSEWWVFRKVVVRHSTNPSESVHLTVLHIQRYLWITYYHIEKWLNHCRLYVQLVWGQGGWGWTKLTSRRYTILNTWFMLGNILASQKACWTSQYSWWRHLIKVIGWCCIFQLCSYNLSIRNDIN